MKGPCMSGDAPRSAPDGGSLSLAQLDVKQQDYKGGINGDLAYADWTGPGYFARRVC